MPRSDASDIVQTESASIARRSRTGRTLLPALIEEPHAPAERHSKSRLPIARSAGLGVTIALALTGCSAGTSSQEAGPPSGTTLDAGAGDANLDAPGQETARKDSSAGDAGEEGAKEGDGSLGLVPEGESGVDGNVPETGAPDGTTADATPGTEAGIADSGEEGGALPDSSAQEEAGAIDVCAATSGALAWATSIPPTGSSLALVDIVAGPTDDVIVADTSGGSTFEQHRWDSAGTFVSSHQDPAGPYAGTLWTSGLFADAANSVFYGMLLTGLPQGANNGVELVFNALSPAGTLDFSATVPGAAPVSSPPPSVTFLQVGGDSSANLHGAFVMANPQTVGQGVYCYNYSGLAEGAGAQNVTSNLTSQDFLWPTPDNDLILFAPISTATDFGCASPLAVSAAGGVALVKTDGGGNCMWNELLALPTAAILSTNFRVGVDGSLNASVVYSGTIDFGGGPLTSTGSSSLAVAKFDSGGNLLWDRSFGGAGSRFGIGSLSVNAAGTVVVTSSYAGTVDLGGGPLAASGDTFLAVFDSTGNLEWAKSLTVGAAGKLLAAAGPCGLVVATQGTAVNLGAGASSPTSVGVAAFGL